VIDIQRAFIWVRLPKSQQNVYAWVSGVLAVHERITETGARVSPPWDVTHVPSGLLVCSANTRDDGVRAMEALLVLDWASVKAGMGKRKQQTFGNKVRNTLRALPGYDKAIWLNTQEGD